jgi:hypothetical protein
MSNAFTNQHELVNISLSILIRMPCYFLHLDSLDDLGYSQLNVNTTVTFRRIAANGTHIGIQTSALNDLCLPCHGLLPEGECCQTCEHLHLLSLWQGKRATPEKWDQCLHPRSLVPEDVSPGENCLVKGKIAVKRISGVFHIAVGRNIQGGKHDHDTTLRPPDVSMRHVIERIRFGVKVPTVFEPLAMIVHNETREGETAYRYHLIVTPVHLYYNGQFAQQGYECKPAFGRIDGAPGLFFKYVFSPYAVDLHIRMRNLLQEAVSLAGFLAGGWTLLSLFAAFF